MKEALNQIINGRSRKSQNYYGIAKNAGASLKQTIRLLLNKYSLMGEIRKPCKHAKRILLHLKDDIAQIKNSRSICRIFNTLDIVSNTIQFKNVYYIKVINCLVKYVVTIFV